MSNKPHAAPSAITPQHYSAVLAKGGKALGVEHVAAADIHTPADRYQELFTAVQTTRIFSDSKTFVDCVPKLDPNEILTRYRSQKDSPKFTLAGFVHEHFSAPSAPTSHYISTAGQPMKAHIDGLWGVLTRRPVEHPAQSSLLPLPRDYVVPGGRFSEMYYWDSYFTMLGLGASGQIKLLSAMAENFAFLIDTYGHIPNGNRTYYLSRSQPPVFALMVELFEHHNLKTAVHYLPQLLKEHAYWMDGSERLSHGQAHRHVVCVEEGTLLNRYWDDRDTPREESFNEDVTTAAGQTARAPAEVYRDLRAAAESGWDFSSRWFGGSDLSSIRTTSLLPVDLNSFMHKLESQIAKLALKSGHTDLAKTFRGLSEKRADAIARYFWSERDGAFVDYDWQRAQAREISAALAAPLYVGLATPAQAHRTAETIRARLLAEGGILTTERESGQQWDAPNGWAPLQWMAIQGLRQFGEIDLANDIGRRWLATVNGLYKGEWKLVEKYALHHASGSVAGGGGGEYPLQDGFGWTNGVVRNLLFEEGG